MKRYWYKLLCSIGFHDPSMMTNGVSEWWGCTRCNFLYRIPVYGKGSGQLDYEEDVKKMPLTCEGFRRPPWEQLSIHARTSWDRPYMLKKKEKEKP